MELLRELMNCPFLNNFYLVGGTSLALQLGHRESIDIDLFGPDYLESIVLLEVLNKLGITKPLKQSKVIKIYEVAGIKVDFVTYHYPWLEEPVVVEGIRMASKQDIAAMKINAITGRGSKKDFIDLFYLLKEYSLPEVMNFYNEKFHDGSTFLALKCLTYFEDADLQESPKMEDVITWPEIKGSILDKYNAHYKV